MRAFFDDPFFCYLAPTEGLRTRGLTLFFGTALRHLGKGSRVVTVRDRNDTIVGVAAWLPPDTYPQSIATQTRPSAGNTAGAVPGDREH